MRDAGASIAVDESLTVRASLTRRITRTCEQRLAINELSAVDRFAALLLVHRTVPLALTALLTEELTP